MPGSLRARALGEAHKRVGCEAKEGNRAALDGMDACEAHKGSPALSHALGEAHNIALKDVHLRGEGRESEGRGVRRGASGRAGHPGRKREEMAQSERSGERAPAMRAGRRVWGGAPEGEEGRAGHSPQAQRMGRRPVPLVQDAPWGRTTRGAPPHAGSRPRWPTARAWSGGSPPRRPRGACAGKREARGGGSEQRITSRELHHGAHPP